MAGEFRGNRLLSGDQLTGLQLLGERVVLRDGVHVVESAMGVNVLRGLLRLGFVQDEANVRYVLADAGVSEKTARLFVREREVARMPAEMGGGLEARPAIPGAADDNLSNYADSEDWSEYGTDDYVVEAEKRVYKLNTLFHDVTATDKLQVSARRLQSAKRLALVDPAAAASVLTEHIRAHGFPNSCVVAGDYAKTVNCAIDFIRSMGRTIVYRDAAAPSVVTPTHLEMTFDQFEKREPVWTVRGPLKYATEVNVVYQMAVCHGPEHVIFMLGAETLRLGIEIYNELTQTYYNGMMAGYSSLEGIRPMRSGFPSELTADQQSRLMAAGKKVHPVTVDGAVVGSAVRVSDKHVILNEHTLVSAMESEFAPVVCGSDIVESMSVAGDVCVVKRAGSLAQWQFRDPDVGERVVLCYSVGNTVEYSEVLQVLGCADQLVLSGSSVLRKGASGAAVVALSDSALLGIFSTMHASRVYCARFSSSSFAIVSDCQSVVSGAELPQTPSMDAGTHTYTKMVKRGFQGFLEKLSNSVAPLYVRGPGYVEVAGLIANVAGEWVTTVDPDASQLSMEDGRMLSFRTVANGAYAAVAPPPVLQAVPNVRAVEPGERVFIFTKVDDDVVMSAVRMVTHCFSNGKGFLIEDIGDSAEVMMGGLVVAERDAAVLGQYSARHFDTYGVWTVQCLSFGVGLFTGAASLATSAHTELAEVVLPSAESLRTHAVYGKTVFWVLVARQIRAEGGMLSVASTVADEMWFVRKRQVLEKLGWQAQNDPWFEQYDEDSVSYAFLALVYLRDALFVSRKLAGLSSDTVASEYTPVRGDFPFPRPGSTVSAVSAGPSLSVVSGGADDTRISDLERRLSALVTMLSDSEKRSSQLIEENGKC